MAEFPEFYFRGEEREGFYIEEMMKRAWAAQIEVLEIIDRICKEYDIQYFADWGTLLGTIRHKGFIPWDDDIDIVMKRDDYNRFLRIFNGERPDGCFLLSIYANEEYNEIFARVVNSNYVNYTKEYLERWHGCPYAVGVDIFPLDKLPVDKDEEDIQCSMLRMLIKAIYSKDETEETIRIIEDMCGVTIDRTKKIWHQLLRVADGVLQMYNDDGADCVSSDCEDADGADVATLAAAAFCLAILSALSAAAFASAISCCFCAIVSFSIHSPVN